jgi:hypothetical protein
MRDQSIVRTIPLFDRNGKAGIIHLARIGTGLFNSFSSALLHPRQALTFFIPSNLGLFPFFTDLTKLLSRQTLSRHITLGLLFFDILVGGNRDKLKPNDHKYAKLNFQKYFKVKLENRYSPHFLL